MMHSQGLAVAGTARGLVAKDRSRRLPSGSMVARTARAKAGTTRARTAKARMIRARARTRAKATIALLA